MLRECSGSAQGVLRECSGRARGVLREWLWRTEASVCAVGQACLAKLCGFRRTEHCLCALSVNLPQYLLHCYEYCGLSLVVSAVRDPPRRSRVPRAPRHVEKRAQGGCKARPSGIIQPVLEYSELQCTHWSGSFAATGGTHWFLSLASL